MTATSPAIDMKEAALIQSVAVAIPATAGWSARSAT
jgi:hypothetical protein